MGRRWTFADLAVARRARLDGKTWEQAGALIGRDAATTRGKLTEEFGAEVQSAHIEPITDAVERARMNLREECRLARLERATAAPFKLRPGELKEYLDG